jgi:flavin-dependent thymidylate synthase
MGEELSNWVDKSMYPAEEIDTMPKVTLLSATADPLGALSAACAMYEGRVIRDLDDLSDDDRVRYWEQVQLTHLKAPLEFIDLHFMVEGVTRAFTHQMVRQRTAVYAQESLRFAVKENVAARPGPLISQDRDATSVWNDAIEHVWAAYKVLINVGVPAEEARGLLPHDTLTRLNFKTNLRNLAEHLGNRLCTQAQFEWRMVGAQIRKAINEYQPPVTIPKLKEPPTYGQMKDQSTLVPADKNRWQFRLIANSGIFRPVCFSMGRCPFQADFDRGCTIRQRADAGEFDKIRTEEWLADPTAGFVR